MINPRRACSARATVVLSVCVCMSTLLEATRRPISDTNGCRTNYASLKNKTWLTHFIYDEEILPKGYTLYRKDRESRGGGVLIAVNDHLPSILFPSPPDLEVVTVRLCPPRNTISICAVYIPPNPDVLYIERLIAFLNFLSTNETSLIITGDFNQPDICWASLSGTSLVSNHFCDFVFVSQLITCPTHIKGNTLDIVLTNDEKLVDNLSVSKCSSSLPSDHYLISFNIPPT